MRNNGGWRASNECTSGRDGSAPKQTATAKSSKKDRYQNNHHRAHCCSRGRQTPTPAQMQSGEISNLAHNCKPLTTQQNGMEWRESRESFHALCNHKNKTEPNVHAAGVHTTPPTCRRHPNYEQRSTPAPHSNSSILTCEDAPTSEFQERQNCGGGAGVAAGTIKAFFACPPANLKFIFRKLANFRAKNRSHFADNRRSCNQHFNNNNNTARLQTNIQLQHQFQHPHSAGIRAREQISRAATITLPRKRGAKSFYNTKRPAWEQFAPKTTFLRQLPVDNPAHSCFLRRQHRARCKKHARIHPVTPCIPAI